MKKKCVHRYLTNCKTNPQPPGIADFLRGSMTLFMLSKRYDYDFFIDYSHPIFQNFEYDQSVFIKTSDDIETLELLPPKSYQDIQNDLINLFEKNEDFYLLTNSPYSGWGVDLNLNQEELQSAYDYIKKVLTLEKERNAEYGEVKTRMKIKDKDYVVVHIRFFDQCLNDPNFGVEQMVLSKFLQFISELERTYDNIVILSNWFRFVDFIRQFKPNLLCYGSKPIHTGDLDKHLGILDSKLVGEKLRDTVFDLKIISESKKNYSISQYGGSGFSYMMSEIYHISFDHVSSRIL
jgi:hypothetical protein